ncbi:MAG: YdiU family protein [Pseudomonadota bacterium]
MDKNVDHFSSHWPIEDRFRKLPKAFYAAPVGETLGEGSTLIHASPQALKMVGLDAGAVKRPGFLEIFSGRQPVRGFAPYATVYAGHQFGHFVPQLGDGRAYTIAQGRHQDGDWWEVQLKGAGRTPFSRFGDGRAVMRSVIREYLCSEHMAALGIPTTRAGSIIATHEGVQREYIEPGAIMSRIAPTHLRFGHFEYFSHSNQINYLRLLLDYTVDVFFADLAGQGDPYIALFNEVVRSTATLMAAWQAIGFAHGVMNTDNMSVLGLTIDYGPFGFLDNYDPGFVCNSSDHTGRYAFERQPSIALWNLQAFASALLPLCDEGSLREVLARFEPAFKEAYFGLMVKKIGLLTEENDDHSLVIDLLSVMDKGSVDYTQTFRSLGALADGGDASAWLSSFGAKMQSEIREWLSRYRARLASEVPGSKMGRMNKVNPKYVLRNWVAETAIKAVEEAGDLHTLDLVFSVVTKPYEEHPDSEKLSTPPPDHLKGLSVSCSS